MRIPKPAVSNYSKEDDMYLIASVQRPWIHEFRSSFIGQRRSHSVMIIDMDAPSEIAWMLPERS